MPRIQHTPDPYASTIISLSNEERYVYQRAQIQAITILPPTSSTHSYTPATFVLSGERRPLLPTPSKDPDPYVSPALTLGDVNDAHLPQSLQGLVSQELAYYIRDTQGSRSVNLQPSRAVLTPVQDVDAGRTGLSQSPTARRYGK